EYIFKTAKAAGTGETSAAATELLVHSFMSKSVILCTFVLVAQCFVGFGYFLELLVRAFFFVYIRVIFFGEFTVCLLNFFLRGILIHSKYIVVVSFRHLIASSLFTISFKKVKANAVGFDFLHSSFNIIYYFLSSSSTSLKSASTTSSSDWLPASWPSAPSAACCSWAICS